MNGYYITASSSADSQLIDGVGKKIKTQIAFLNSCGFNIKLLALYNKPGLLNKLQRKFFSDYYTKFLPDDFFDCDYYYIRKFMVSRSLLGLLRNIRKRNKSKILLEIPTYPYDKEMPKGFFNFLTLCLDKILRKKLKKYVDRIVTVSADEMIFEIKTIRITNGINCAEIPIRSRGVSNNSVHIIAAAQFSRSHGYERLIKGLYLYYRENPARKVYLSFAGEGKELPLYKQLADDYGLTDYIQFKGFLSGTQLNDFFNSGDIAACSLGCHRIDLYLGSFLKSREYLARGLPMVSSTKIDILPKDFPYCFYVPEDESPISIQSVLDFYTNLTGKKSVTEITDEIRHFAEDNCDISKTMAPVVFYLQPS
jgi:glycosyltransferase involved in cell wall biosynthesis